MISNNIDKEILIKYLLDFNKIDYTKIKKIDVGKLIVITSISPTEYGEGKTTSLIGLVDAFNHNFKNAIGCLRQPSLGPYLGLKGGATGSGKCILKNSKKINLGLTGDFQKIELANNLIVTILENEVFYNTDLLVDPNKILIKRCVDLNDRSLRNITYNINENNIKTSYVITAASWLMTLLCKCENKKDFVDKLSNSIIAYSKDNKPITISDLNIIDTIVDILSDTFYPNLASSYYDSPILVHTGPFANISIGCSSLISIKSALKLADYAFVECGFGSDLGLEKFVNIMCKNSGLKPDLVIYVISLKSILKHSDNDLNKGISHLTRHLDICKSFNLKPIVILNYFTNDDIETINSFVELCRINGIKIEIFNGWSEGPSNSKYLINFIEKNIPIKKTKINFTYSKEDTISDKIEKIVLNIYRGKKVIYSDKAKQKIYEYEEFNEYDVCFAKTHLEILPDNNEEFYVEDLDINHAGRIIVVIDTKVYLMPGLPQKPNAKNFINKK